ncbi:MAG TPA: type II toxin-antitoxin system prevent-host-death family antitoxin [Candidatus Rokubacteria bacterium]|nr:type II toxin-antitoxin system prevent-host-death family antitoxin [Candidatus Rokubacteria bacterium]
MEAVMDVGIYEAKSKLSQLVEKAEAGEEVILTRRGRPVAKIVNVAPAARRNRALLLREIRALARRVKIPKRVSIRDIVAEGRD